MWQHASLVRDARGLGKAAEAIDHLTDEVEGLRASSVGGAARILDLRAGLDCARAIVAAAEFRTESRGAHWRADFPETSDAWLGSTLVRWAPDASRPDLEFCPKPRSHQTQPYSLPAPRKGNG
jgi:succinate dehydrogenase/fumarate reductase flavoprotein subunit